MEIEKINETELAVKEYQNLRVVTFKDIDAVHGRPEGTASRNFRNNRERFIEGEDFFKISSDEIRRTNLFDIPDKATTDYVIILWQQGRNNNKKAFKGFSRRFLLFNGKSK